MFIIGSFIETRISEKTNITQYYVKCEIFINLWYFCNIILLICTDKYWNSSTSWIGLFTTVTLTSSISLACNYNILLPNAHLLCLLLNYDSNILLFVLSLPLTMSIFSLCIFFLSSLVSICHKFNYKLRVEE